MYQKGYVLVRIHDVAYEAPDENGNVRFVKGSVMLPEGKKPFVMSQDDVCYYLHGRDGFAKRVVIGEDGKPTCEMVMDDGTTSTGSYDLIPLLEDFIQEHPDFPTKGQGPLSRLPAMKAYWGTEPPPPTRTAPPMRLTVSRQPEWHSV